jgi:hypothetical protein
VGAHWGRFIAEHVYFYDSLLRKVLLRFLRLDLSCGKNAFMLFRVCKVLNQEGLPEAIREVVANAAPTAASFFNDSHHHQGHQDPNQQGNGNIFDSDFTSAVSSLVMRAAEAKRTLLEQRQTLTQGNVPNNRNRDNENWVATMLIYLVQLTSTEQQAESGEVDELDRTVQHMDFCVDRLVKIFELSVSVEEVMSASSPSSGFGRSSPVGKRMHDESEPLTPGQRWDIINRTSKYRPKFHGNPDEAPLRSDECHLLARLLHRLSMVINAKFPGVGERYEESTAVGAVLRQFCEPPATFTVLTKHSLVRSEHRMPARIVLRPFSSHRNMFYLALAFAFGWLFGRRFAFKLLFFAFTFWATKLFFTVFTSDSSEKGRSRQQQLN